MGSDRLKEVKKVRYWKRLNPNGSTRTVESYSRDLDVDGATEITEQEFNDYIASLPEPEPEPPDPDTIRAEEILATSPDAITQPQIWELLRIFGRKFGFRF